MEPLEALIEMFFADGFTIADSGIEILMVVALIAFEIINRKLTSKQINSDRTETAVEQKVSRLEERNQELSNQVALMADMVAVSFLSSTATDTDVKKKIALSAQEIQKRSNINFDEFTQDLISRIVDYVPGEKLAEHREALANQADQVSETLSASSEKVQSMVDKLGIE